MTDNDQVMKIPEGYKINRLTLSSESPFLKTPPDVDSPIKQMVKVRKMLHKLVDQLIDDLNTEVDARGNKILRNSDDLVCEFNEQVTLIIRHVGGSSNPHEWKSL